MGFFKFFIVSVFIGIVVLIVGHIVSYYLLPKPHLIFGPLLAIAAFILAWKYPLRWITASIGVLLPFLITGLYSIPQLISYTEASNASITLIDYIIMLSPLGLALIGGGVGRMTAK